MATFLQGATDFFPPEQLFTPNWSLIQQGLMVKQSAYDKGFAQLSGTARAVIDSPLLNKYTKEARKQILADAEQALKDLPNLDLSLPQNAAEASSLFRPFYEDENILFDMMQTKRYMSERQRGMDLAKSSKEEDRNRYWTYGIQDLDNWAEEFSDLSVDKLKDNPARSYIAKPNVDDKILKLFSEGKLKTSYDQLTGEFKFTYENGEPLRDPITNLYLSQAENDPEAMAGFGVIGRVKRAAFIKDNVANGRYATREEAAAAHDNALVVDYYNTQKAIYDQTKDALSKIENDYNNYKQKADNNLIIPGTEEFTKAVKVTQLYNRLKGRADKIAGDIFSVGNNPPAYLNRILGNPTAYLADVALRKQAIDLATSLSQFGSTKIDLDPRYEKLTIPAMLADIKLEKDKQLEQFKTGEAIRKQELEYELKLKYGIPLSGDGSGTSTDASGKTVRTGSGIIRSTDVPYVEEFAAGAGVQDKTKFETTNAYGSFDDKVNDIRDKVVTDKLAFIEAILKPDEIKTIDGDPIPMNKRWDMINMRISPQKLSQPSSDFTSQSLLSSYGSNKAKWQGIAPTSLDEIQARSKYKNEFDRLYDLAMDRYKSWEQTGTNIPQYLAAADRLARIKNQDNLWTAAIQWKKEKLSEVINNLTGSYPDKATEFKAMFNGTSLVDSPTQYIDNVKALATDADVQTLKQTFLDRANIIRSRMARDRDQPGDAAEYKKLNDALSLNKNDFLTLYIAENQAKFLNTYNQNLETVKQTWNERGNEFNYFSTFDQKGGGMYGRAATFTSLNTEMNEKADQYIESLFKTISMADLGAAGGYSQDKVKIDYSEGKVNPNKVTSRLDAQALLAKLKPEILNTIKLGVTKQGQTIPVMTFTTNQVAGNNPDWSAYTLKFDNKWIDGNIGTKEKSGLLTKDDAENLRKGGITIYVKKKNTDGSPFDVSLAAQNATIGEVDLLLNAGNGSIKEEIAPGYSFQISRLSTGGYDIITNFNRGSSDKLGAIVETPISERQTVDANTDINELYYQLLNGIRTLMIGNADARRRVETSRTQNPAIPKASWNDILKAANQ